MITTSKLQKEQAHALNVIHQQYLRLLSMDVNAQRITLAIVAVEQPWSAPKKIKCVRLVHQHKLMDASVIRVILEFHQTVCSVMLANSKKDMVMDHVKPVLLIHHCLQVPLVSNPFVLHVHQDPIPLRAILQTAVYASRAMKRNQHLRNVLRVKRDFISNQKVTISVVRASTMP